MLKGRGDKKVKNKIALKTLAISIVFVVVASGNVAAQPGPVTVQGVVTYADGTLVPDGWTVLLENLDECYPSEPWATTTDSTLAPFNYLVTGTAQLTSTFVITASDPAEIYTGTETFTAYLLETCIINITVTMLCVTVEYPNGGEEIAIGNIVEVSASATDDTEVVSVDFSYSADNGTTWNTIGAGSLASGDTMDGIWNVSWDTTGRLIVGDEYLIKAVATDNEANTVEDESDSTFSLMDKGKPLFKNAEVEPSTILVGETTEVTFSIDAADKESEVYEVRVYYGATLIGSMSLVGSYIQDTLAWKMYEFQYDLTPPAEATYSFSVVPMDTYGNYNTTTVSVEAVNLVTYNITLYPGMNLISLPLMPNNVSIEAVIPAGQAADGDWIYADKPGQGLNWEYACYSSGWKGTLTTLEPEKGYLYNRAGPDFNISVTGTPLTSVNTTIYEGWNLLGYAKTESASLSIINEPCDWDWIYAWEPDIGWEYVYYYSGGWYGTFIDFTPGEGYVYCRAGPTFYWIY